MVSPPVKFRYLIMKRGNFKRVHWRSGTTLVELLVVFGIIAVIAGLILTVTMLVFHRSKAAVCGSNLGQIGKAMLSYASDNEDRVPPYISSDQLDWRTHPEPLSGTQAWIEALTVYGASKQVFRCPSDSNFGTDAKDYPGDSFKYSSYFVHSDVGSGFPAKDGNTTYTISQIDEPSYRVYAGDKSLAERKELPDGGWQPRFYGAHGYMFNAVCMDGRVVDGRYDHTDGKFGKY